MVFMTNVLACYASMPKSIPLGADKMYMTKQIQIGQSWRNMVDKLIDIKEEAIYVSSSDKPI